MTTQSIIRLSVNPEGFADNVDELDADNFASALPTQHSLDYVSDEELGVYVGVWDTTSMQESAGAYEFEEFMVVLAGFAEIKNNKTGLVTKVSAGQAFVIPRGFDCQWIQNGYLKKFYFIVDNEQLCASNKDANNITIIDQDTLQKYQNKQQNFHAGVDNYSYKSSQSAVAAQRFIYVLSGQVTVTDEHNIKHEFSAGDAFYLAKSKALIWQASENFQSYFVHLYH